MSKIDLDTIVKTAWKLVDHGGLDCFSFRIIARELGVTPMAIYHHVDSKAHLATLMVEAANGEHPAFDDGQHWKQGLWSMALWHWNNRLAHPALGELQRNFKVFTPTLLKASANWIHLWQQSGLDEKSALLAARASSNAVSGLVDEEVMARDEGQPDENLLALVPAARHLFNQRRPSLETFELTVRALIDGLFDTLSNGLRSANPPYDRSSKSTRKRSRKSGR